MERNKLLAALLVVGLLVVVTAAAVAGTLYGIGALPGYEAVDTPTSEPVEDTAANQTEIPDSVNASYGAATELKRSLDSDTYTDARVFIDQNGEIIVTYTSQASYGPELKEEMTYIALEYAAIIGDHDKAGGLTVRANGVNMLASKDTALAYNRGDIKESAYEKTLLFTSKE